VKLTIEEFLEDLARYGLVIAGQTADLAPADGKLYALRDVTATVGSLPLIASSIMSKKIAAGAHAIVLDVKVGRGAFMKTEGEAIALARTMVEIGQSAGRKIAAVISDMNQPLGRAVGNALEVAEAIETLKGAGPEDFLEQCLVVATQMLLLAGRGQASREMLLEALGSGRALEKLGALIEGQGGDRRVLDHPALLPRARFVEELRAPRSGYVAALDALEVGLTAVLLGAGRTRKGEPIDHSVGIVLHKKIGHYVEKDEPLLTIHANDEQRLSEARRKLLDAYSWSDAPVEPPPLIHQIIAS
jgi:pyrimidine-nucleoside phosphorylase